MTVGEARVPHLTRDRGAHPIPGRLPGAGGRWRRVEKRWPRDPNHSPTNTERAYSAFVALTAYFNHYGGEDLAQSQITDLVNDLHHLADAYGVSWESLENVSTENYDQEANGEC
jgi:hypothetical protein